MCDCSAQSLPLLFTILLAFVGWLVAFALAERKRVQDRKTQEETRRANARIAYLNSQIQNLYGPLFALFNTNDAAWKSFRELYLGKGFGNATKIEQNRARTWMTSVFSPINRDMVDTIIANTHLIDGGDFPEAFKDLFAHVKAWEGVLAQWKRRYLIRRLSQ